MLASVKKIQRAWRNYTTKKLLKSYSNDIRLKCKQPIDSSDCLLSVRSQGRSLRFKSMHLDKT